MDKFFNCFNTVVYLSNVLLVEELFLLFLIVASIIFALVLFFVFYFSRKYKSKSNEEIPEQNHGNRKFEIGMTLLVTSIVAVFFVLTVKAMRQIQNIPEKPEPDLIITGHQWWWEAQYPKSGVITANEIHVPIKKNILLQLNSEDVIHSWWVPKLGRKMDMIPGVNNYMWLYADEVGEYLGGCSEFCGDQHGRMRIRVIAQSAEDFKQWQTDQLQPVASVSEGLFLEGKQLFEEKTCISCHRIKGSKTVSDIGPDLSHFASRKMMLADFKINNRQNLKAWLKAPSKIKEGAKMPDYILTEHELEALTVYINHLK